MRAIEREQYVEPNLIYKNKPCSSAMNEWVWCTFDAVTLHKSILFFLSFVAVIETFCVFVCYFHSIIIVYEFAMKLDY